MNGPLTVGSLFSGIGGIDLGLERTGGFRVHWQCEIDAYCRRILDRHWPGVPCYPDVRSLGVDRPAERVDVLAAGFPCQPVSLAGRGLAQADERWLWPEVARLVRLLRPRYVLLENVPGLLARGMGDVLGDLAACGYDAEWDSIGAVDVGAPHRRKRVWIVAYPGGAGRQGAEPEPAGGRHRPAHGGAHVADAEGGPERAGLREGVPPGERRRRLGDGGGAGDVSDAAGEPAEQGDVYQRHAGGDGPRIFGAAAAALSAEWAAEPDVGRVAHGVPARVDRLRALGNAVVPQVVEHVGRLILADALLHDASRSIVRR